MHRKVLLLCSSAVLMFSLTPGTGITPKNHNQVTAVPIAVRSTDPAAVTFASPAPKCDDAPPGAPCYATVFTSKEGGEAARGGRISPTATDVYITCGVKVWDRLGVLVAKMSQRIGVDWGTNSWTETSASRSTWKIDWRYGWTDLHGPSPSSGTYTYNEYKWVTTSGRLTYFGAVWKSYEVRLRITGNNKWSCSVY
jgi:hypothetical protein